MWCIVPPPISARAAKQTTGPHLLSTLYFGYSRGKDRRTQEMARKNLTYSTLRKILLLLLLLFLLLSLLILRFLIQLLLLLLLLILLLLHRLLYLCLSLLLSLILCLILLLTLLLISFIRACEDTFRTVVYCRIQYSDTPRAGRVGAAHGGATGQHGAW